MVRQLSTIIVSPMLPDCSPLGMTASFVLKGKTADKLLMRKLVAGTDLRKGANAAEILGI